MDTKIYRISAIMEMTGLSRSWIYLAVSKGEFPKPIKIGKRAIGWPESVIKEWIQGKVQ